MSQVKYNWYGRTFDGTEQPGERVLNDQNVIEYEFANLSVGYAVEINGILIPPGGVFRESFDSNAKTGGEYRFNWLDWSAGGSYFTQGYGRPYKYFSVREKRQVGVQDKRYRDA